MIGDNLRVPLSTTSYFAPYFSLFKKIISVADTELATAFFTNHERTSDTTALQVELEVLFQFC